MDFIQFITQNPGMGVNELKREARANGISVPGGGKANALIREIRELPLNEKKARAGKSKGKNYTPPPKAEKPAEEPKPGKEAIAVPRKATRGKEAKTYKLDVFKDFARRVLEEEPKASNNRVAELWREAGGTISRADLTESMREVRGVEYNPLKATAKITYTHVADSPYHYRSRYSYNMTYYVTEDGSKDPIPVHVTIISGRELTRPELYKKMLKYLESEWDKEDAKYKNRTILLHTIQLNFAVYNPNPTVRA